MTIPKVPGGWAIFPCWPNSKAPWTKHGFHEASTDPEQWAAWDRINPNFNWAVATGASNLFVFDIDPNGLDWWSDLLEANPEIKREVESTYRVKTPRGGEHVYFIGSGPTTASAIADGIDTRSVGGYVLLLGSSTPNGDYQAFSSPSNVRNLPSCLAQIIPERRKGKVNLPDWAGTNGSVDAEENIAWAIQLLQRFVESGEVSMSGSGGNNTAFRIACAVLDKGISPEKAVELLEEHWNPHCQPPWDLDDLTRIVANATQYGEETREGSKGFQPGEDVFAAFKGFDNGDSTEPVRNRSRLIMRLSEIRQNLRPPTWLVDSFIPSNGSGIFYGGRSSYKSFLMLDMCLSVANGLTAHWRSPPEKQNILYFAGEGLSDFSHSRAVIWEKEHGVEDSPVYASIGGVARYNDTEAWSQIKREIEEMDLKPAMIVIDTIALLMAGINENDNSEVTKVTNFLNEMAMTYNCFVLGVHHSGKDESKGARGASAWEGNVDTVLHAKAQPGGMAFRVTKQRSGPYDTEKWFHFAANQVEYEGIGKSVILTPRDSAPNEERTHKSRIAWLDDVIPTLARMGGEATTDQLAEEISADVGILKATVKKNLMGAIWLSDMRHGDTWRIRSWDL